MPALTMRAMGLCALRLACGLPGATRMPAAGRPAAHHPRCSWLAGLLDPVPAGLLLTIIKADRDRYLLE
nr:hypothetical protein [Alcaligenes faecalis]